MNEKVLDQISLVYKAKTRFDIRKEYRETQQLSIQFKDFQSSVKMKRELEAIPHVKVTMNQNFSLTIKIR